MLFQNEIYGEQDPKISVIVNDVYQRRTTKFSTANAAKPLTYFVSLFGMQLIRYSKNSALKTSFYSKLYCVLIVAAIVSLIVFVKPFSWRYTADDVPLNVLTKAYTLFHTIEVIHAIFITSFINSPNYVALFKTLDSVDKHFGTSKKVFKTKMSLSIVLIILPVTQTSYTFWLTKFNINNISAHITFFVVMLQGAIIVFFSLNIYLKQIMLNRLLILKTFETIPNHKSKLFKESIFSRIVKNVLREPLFLEKNKRRYSWLELMTIYDKVSDSIFVFNKIYSGQVFIMFSSWLMCTLLTICRSLSPTIKYSKVIASDLFMYSSLNGRPIFLTKICELYMGERKKTLDILINHQIRGNLDDEYLEQVQTMIDLVKTKKIQVTGNVFTVDAVTVMNFSGSVISYAVLMIQYFYIYVFLK